jgi:hypothetical protein
MMPRSYQRHGLTRLMRRSYAQGLGGIDGRRAPFTKEGDLVLSSRAPTALMHAGFDQQTIADAYAADEIAAKTEYGAEFRSDLRYYTSAERAAILPGWLAHYNCARAHGSLDVQPPLSRFPGGNNLMLVHS